VEGVFCLPGVFLATKDRERRERAIERKKYIVG
jgi:hypothetical protein